MIRNLAGKDFRFTVVFTQKGTEPEGDFI